MFKNFIHDYKDIFYFSLLSRNLKDCDSVLDIACGSNSPLVKIKKHFYSEGLDIFRKSIGESKKKRIHDKYRIADVMDIDMLYKEKSFDVVIALDILEHLKKPEGLKLIKKMEKIAKKKVIIMTPNGFQSQEEFEDNPYQVHKSGWFFKDFKNLGFTVYGLRGLKYLRGELASIKYRPWVFWGFLAFISEPVLHFFPKISYQLIALKDVTNEK